MNDSAREPDDSTSGQDADPAEVARMEGERQAALDRFGAERGRIVAGLAAFQDDIEAQVAAGTLSLAQAAVTVEAARLEALDEEAAALRAAGAHIEDAAAHPPEPGPETP